VVETTARRENCWLLPKSRLRRVEETTLRVGRRIFESRFEQHACRTARRLLSFSPPRSDFVTR